MYRLILLAALGMSVGCAGATIGSGVGDRQLEHPPYYAGSGAAAARIVRYPIGFQPGASQAPMFDPASAAGTPVAALLAEMNRFADSVFAGAAVPMPNDKGMLAPDTYFGCERDATDDCVARGDSVLGRRGTTMRLAVARPSGDWIRRHAALLDSANATHALLITLEVGQYWPRQSGWLGTKSVELGTDHRAEAPWLTSLETPVSVLQLTAALVDREGKAVRIGAEGLLAQRTPLVASAMGAQRLVTDADVERARAMRHEDRPGKPLVWKAALCQLVGDLAARRC